MSEAKPSRPGETTFKIFRWIIFGVGVLTLGAVDYYILKHWPIALMALLALVLGNVLYWLGSRVLGHFRKAKELEKRQRIAETIGLIKHALPSQRRAE